MDRSLSCRCRRIILLLLLLVRNSTPFASPRPALFGTIRHQWKRKRVRVDARNGDALRDANEPSPHSHGPQPPFIVREIREEDLAAASNILADSFLDEKDSNFFTRRIERMNAYLSLKSRFETFRYAERSGALQCMLVGCIVLDDVDDDTVVGFCEVDDRPPGGEINPAPRPYISSLAVNVGFRRGGLATALVSKSEEIAKGWGKRKLHLRVSEDNEGAQAMYCKCGYEAESSYDDAEGKTVMMMEKLL